MTGPLTAWIVILVAAVGAAWLVFVALRRWPRLRWLGAGLVIAWTATPFPYGEGHLAPAFVVFFFRRFLEEAANPRPPLALLLLATLLVAVVYAVAGLIVWRRNPRHRVRRKVRTRR